MGFAKFNELLSGKTGFQSELWREDAGEPVLAVYFFSIEFDMESELPPVFVLFVRRVCIRLEFRFRQYLVLLVNGFKNSDLAQLVFVDSWGIVQYILRLCYLLNQFKNDCVW